MSYVLTFRRRREPEEPHAAVLYFGLIAATGFVAGWVAQALGVF
ncbi:hypothetical protein LJR219_000183 [Phenylobacterium sp. LjRoot219]